jgi:phosphatidate cytidylyltransferase
MLRQRLLVAAVGLPLLAAAVAAPEPVFGALVTLILALATYEFLRAALPESPPAARAAAAALVALFAASARTLESFPELSLLGLIAVAALALGVLLWPRPDDTYAAAAGAPHPLPAATWWFGGVLYLGAFGTHWLLLRAGADGRAWVIVTLAATFATDTGAYAVGRLVGRHRFVPRISPHKTWEGAAGGLAAGALATVALVALLPAEPRLDLASGTLLDTLAARPWLLVFAVALPLAAIVGDLVESALKRRMHVKDTSHLLPGHGGLLDRLDSLLATGPLLYWLVQWATH